MKLISSILLVDPEFQVEQGKEARVKVGARVGARVEARVKKEKGAQIKARTRKKKCNILRNLNPS
jgi:hypothetical protein